MFKNQLQELAQRSCFNLPSYSCIREGPDHAPRFKATVNFNGETFESPTFCSTLRQAEHAAAEIALNTLANRGPSRALAARVLDETGVYKNLLQETAHRAGLNLPVYTTIRSGPGHVPIFTCTVELAGMSFTGEPARTKKQAQKSAAVAAWSALKKLAQSGSSSSPSPFSHSLESKGNEEQEQAIIARLLASLHPSERGNSTQNDQLRHGQHRSIPFCRDSTPPIPSLYPTLCQSWASSGVSPEMPMYQMWQQEQLLQHQNCLLALPFPPATLPGPQNFPFLQSMFYPDYCLYFPAREQESMAVRPRITIATSGPSFYFSNHSVPNTIRGRSTVTIQEIHDDKTEEFSDFPPTAVPRIQEPVREDDKQKNSVLETNIGNIQLEGNRTRQSEWTCSLSMDSSFTPVDFQLQNPRGFNCSQSNLRPKYAPRASSYRSFIQTSVAAPVDIRSVNPTYSAGPRSQYLATGVSAPPRMRTGAPTCSTSPRPERLNLGGRRPTFIAPAVRIRSVVPVCSAPPARKMPSSSQEEVPPITKKNDAQPVDVSTASLELGKLQL